MNALAMLTHGYISGDKEVVVEVAPPTPTVTSIKVQEPPPPPIIITGTAAPTGGG